MALRTFAGFDMGDVNFSATVLRYAPEERRAKNMAASKVAALPAPLPERMEIIATFLANWKVEDGQDPFRCVYRRGQPSVVLPHLKPADYATKKSSFDISNIMAWHVGNWAPLFEVDASGRLPRVAIEQPGDTPSLLREKNLDQLSKEETLELHKEKMKVYEMNCRAHATAAAVRAADAARGFRFDQRTVEFTAKKKDVERSSEASKGKQHKAESIRVARIVLEKCGEQEMLDFLDDVKHSGQKLDDIADSLNLARAVDVRTIVEVQEELAAIRLAAAATAKRSRDEEDEEELETPPKKKHRAIVVHSSSGSDDLAAPAEADESGNGR